MEHLNSGANCMNLPLKVHGAEQGMVMGTGEIHTREEVVDEVGHGEQRPRGIKEVHLQPCIQSDAGFPMRVLPEHYINKPHPKP